MRFFAVALIFSGVAPSYAQTPEVPHKMHFADMTLTIRDDARREIQKDVDALTKSPKYFGIKVERARTYFPFIEKIFAEERLPDDFKYLALQESALIADAVSVSNAVGFWQFKDFTAIQMGMRVDKQIDERMNIISASRGAAKYLKENNYQFDNWLVALQAYQMGAGGVKRLVGDKFNGVRHMEITSDTYWYVKKFIAHKLAFEKAVQGEPQVKIQIIKLREKKELSDLAKELGIDETELATNNKWILSSSIPDDRTYALLLPIGKFNEDFNKLLIPITITAVASPDERTDALLLPKGKFNEDFNKLLIPATTTAVTSKGNGTPIRKEINGVMAIQALANVDHAAMAARAGVSLSDFLKFNDLSISNSIREGEFYFTAKKKNRSSTLTHTLAKGEDLWLVSQHYGVSLKRIKKLNRLRVGDDLSAGDVAWLHTKRPLNQPVDETPVLPVVKTENGDFFDWEANPGTSDTIVVSKPTLIVENTKSEKKSDTESKVETVVVNPSSNEGNHVVAPGETLYAIAKKYNVAVTQMMEWNQLDITRGLQPGQYIRTMNPAESVNMQPEPKPIEVKSEYWITHEVKTSDTLYSIARQYNVTIKEIMDWNGMADFSLSKGDSLKILTR